MAKIRLVVVGFKSHVSWAKGYQQASRHHDIYIHTIPPDRWKFRMQSGACLELESLVEPDDDIVVLDGGLLDVTPLVALLRSRTHSPLVLLYMHENQLTTRFTSQDRDKKNNTHWLYGMCHWRSLLVSDGFLFNSRQHLTAFAHSLPRLLQEQCPRDVVHDYLERATQLVDTKCVVLRYGLYLDHLLPLSTSAASNCNDTTVHVPPDTPTSSIVYKKPIAKDDTPPVLLWNARLEQDKDPESFIRILTTLKEQKQVSFQLIVLGTDPTKGQVWYARFRETFSEELLYLGWCDDRDEYIRWLQTATIVISTAQHETFGASVVESVACGVLPLLPVRLSYPELLSVDKFPFLFYTSDKECVTKLVQLMECSKDENKYRQIVTDMQAAVKPYCWSTMGAVYDTFFTAVLAGEDLKGAEQASTVVADTKDAVVGPLLDAKPSKSLEFQTVFEASDPRVALFRPKSVRDHKEFQKQLLPFLSHGLDPPTLHGGRRSTARMLEAISTGSRIVPLCFLTTLELAHSVLAPRFRERQSKNAPIYVADKVLIDAIRCQKLNTGDSILSMVQFPLASPLSEVLANPPILVLDNVRNAENVGSILRTAFCLGITSVVASRTTWGALRDSRSARCSMGTIYYHTFYKVESRLEDTLGEIRNSGIRVYGVEIGHEAQPVTPYPDSDRRWAAVLGNENVGLAAEVGQACDSIVFVPQAHGDSLNVGHAAAITLFELGRNDPIPEHDGCATWT